MSPGKRTRKLLASGALALTAVLAGCADDDITFSNPKGCFYDGGVDCDPPDAAPDATPDARPDGGTDAGDGG